MRAFAFACLVVLPACPLLEVEGEVEEVCLSYRGVKLPGLPIGQTTVSTDFMFDQLEGTQALADTGGTITVTRGALRATSGVSDFSFVQNAELSIASADPDSTLPTLTVFACEDCATSSTTLEVGATTTAPVGDYIKGPLVVSVELKGDAPATDWTADVDFCMSADLSYQLR